MTIAEAFAEWASSLRGEPLDAAVRAEVSRHLLDGLGTAVAAYRLGIATAGVTVAATFRVPAEATIIGEASSVPAGPASLANGTLVHGLDFDDTHTDALVHPTAVILPTVFAIGQRVGATGQDVLTAAAIGFETIIRLGASVRHGFHSNGFHATSVCGTPAAALAASWLSGADARCAVNAIGIAASQSSGLLEFLHSDATTKQLHAGWAASAGIMAADLAAAGATGPASAIEGDYGLVRSFTRAAAPDIAADLGERWSLLGTTLKPYPVCQLSHAALDALASVRDEIPIDAVDRIDVDVPAGSVPIVCEPVERKLSPASPYEAKFSLQWCVAALLVDGDITIASFDDDRVNRPGLVDLAARVRYRPFDPDTAPADAPGRVRVHLSGGETIEASVPRSRGGPDLPMTDDDVIAKFVANCGTPEAARVADAVLRLDEAPDVTGILDLVNPVTRATAT